ncbi:MAG: superoxide dismutase [Enterobacteriaceae bacterium]
MKLKFPLLDYNYKDLEPFIDEETMLIHHLKHHKSYTENAKNIINKNNIKLSNSEIIDLVKNEKINNKLKNNIGGYINHNIFWKSLKKGTKIKHKTKKIIKDNFLSLDNFINNFEKISINHFGSGWTWLVKDKKNKLFILSTINQNYPNIVKNNKSKNLTPIFNLDLWEHSYYLNYKNDKIKYIKSFWKIINWNFIEEQISSINPFLGLY